MLRDGWHLLFKMFSGPFLLIYRANTHQVPPSLKKTTQNWNQSLSSRGRHCGQNLPTHLHWPHLCLYTEVYVRSRMWREIVHSEMGPADHLIHRYESLLPVTKATSTETDRNKKIRAGGSSRMPGDHKQAKLQTQTGLHSHASSLLHSFQCREGLLHSRNTDVCLQLWGQETSELKKNH